MSLVSSIERIGQVLVGAAEQLANEVTTHVQLPIPGLPPSVIGDILTPVGADARAGADALEHAVDVLLGRVRTDHNAARTQRPLLAATTVHATSAASLQRIHFDATAAGADWGVKGHESGRIAVYVDGRYQSSVIVLAERSGGYSVDLGALPPGDHQIELRAPDDVTGTASPRVSVGAISCSALTGDEALVARYAPILELQDFDPTAGNSTTRSDAPMLLVPTVIHGEDGVTTIAYRVAFSNEEGGTPSPKLLAEYGRTADLEPVYTVRLRPDGSRIDDFYQSAIHSWRPFDGTREGDRALIRDCSANSMSSTRVHATGLGAERWSPAPIPAVTRTTSDYDVLSANPWTWTLMAKEVIREGKAVPEGAPRTSNQVGDPRSYVFVGPLTDAQMGAITAAGGLELIMKDGRHVLAKLAPRFASGPWKQGALELPAGALADAIAGVSMLGVRVSVFDHALHMHELPVAA